MPRLFTTVGTTDDSAQASRSVMTTMFAVLGITLVLGLFAASEGSKDPEDYT